MLTMTRHGVQLVLDDRGFAATPWVYRPIAKDRWYEEGFLQHVRSLGRTGVYVDVGAHLGTATVWFGALCPSTMVHAIEPVARYVDVLRRNVRANGLEHKVKIHQLGVGQKAGTATNHLTGEHQVGFDGIRSRDEAVDETFPVVRLDDLVTKPVAVLKIDVEGMEAEVLRGATRILDWSRPVVFAEAWDQRQAHELELLLRDFGYRPTGRVFNATPTYEFAAPPARGVELLRPGWRRVPAALRRCHWGVRSRRASGPKRPTSPSTP